MAFESFFSLVHDYMPVLYNASIFVPLKHVVKEHEKYKKKEKKIGAKREMQQLVDVHKKPPTYSPFLL